QEASEARLASDPKEEEPDAEEGDQGADEAGGLLIRSKAPGDAIADPYVDEEEKAKEEDAGPQSVNRLWTFELAAEKDQADRDGDLHQDEHGAGQKCVHLLQPQHFGPEQRQTGKDDVDATAYVRG